MRILVTGEIRPWPMETGGAFRLANVIEGLSRIGEVHLFVLLYRKQSLTVPPWSPVERIGSVQRPHTGFRGAKRLGWLLWGSRPSRFVWRDADRVVQDFREWAAPPYDLAWLGGMESHLLFAPNISAPTVVDLYDVESEKLRGLMKLTGKDRPPVISRRRARYDRLRLKTWRNQELWRRLERRVGQAADLMVVCSSLEAQRLEVRNSYVIPNAYDAPQFPVGTIPVGNPPTLLFQGTLGYEPNADAARYLVEEIGPHLWPRLPDARIRLAGRAPDYVRTLEDPPRVTVTGAIPDMTAELARADLVAVPIRYGGGTRVKILEAFAHRIPVVSTTLGAEGLDVINGRHALLADDPRSFAENCARVLGDESLRRSLVDEAHRLFLQRFESKQVQELVAQLGSAVANGGVRAREATRADQPD
jgi:glycosyltransferase involved in cell wall biosynthesis